MRNRTGYDLAEHWVVNHMGRNSPRKCIFAGITKSSSLILQKNGNALKQVSGVRGKSHKRGVEQILLKEKNRRADSYGGIHSRNHAMPDSL